MGVIREVRGGGSEEPCEHRDPGGGNRSFVQKQLGATETGRVRPILAFQSIGRLAAFPTQREE